MAAQDAKLPDDGDDYLQRVERHFGLRRGGRLMLSPRDWQLVQEWQEAGIPVVVVMRGINRAFDQFEAAAPRPDRINSLSYCKQHVLETWEEHRELAATDPVHREPSSDTDGATDHLRLVAERCRAAAARRGETPDEAEALEDAATALEELATAVGADELDTRQIDARAEEIEAATRARVPEALEPAPGQDVPELPRFSPWAV